MRRVLTLAGVIALAMMMVGPAWAKGPTGATIAGPGIDEPIVLEGNGERSTGGEFSAFVEAAGFWQLVVGVEPDVTRFGETIDAPPARLGARYTLTWHLGDERVTTELYPSADGGPVLHMEAQRVESLDNDAPERWFAADATLLTMLDGYGVPFRAPVPAPPTPAPAQPAPAPAQPAPTGAASPAAAATPADATDSSPWAIWIAGAVVAATALAVVAGRRRAGAA